MVGPSIIARRFSKEVKAPHLRDRIPEGKVDSYSEAVDKPLSTLASEAPCDFPTLLCEPDDLTDLGLSLDLGLPLTQIAFGPAEAILWISLWCGSVWLGLRAVSTALGKG